MGLKNDKIGLYCGVPAASVLLDVHPKTIYKRVRAGTIPAGKVGNKIFFTMTDLIEIRNKEQK